VLLDGGCHLGGRPELTAPSIDFPQIPVSIDDRPLDRSDAERSRVVLWPIVQKSPF
jgi:hypothetical protein